MTVFFWILLSGILVSAIARFGSVTLLLVAFSTCPDLVPEVSKHAESGSTFLSFSEFATGLALLPGIKLMLG